MEGCGRFGLKGTGSRALQLRKLEPCQATVCKSFRLVPGGGGRPGLILGCGLKAQLKVAAGDLKRLTHLRNGCKTWGWGGRIGQPTYHTELGLLLGGRSLGRSKGSDPGSSPGKSFVKARGAGVLCLPPAGASRYDSLGSKGSPTRESRQAETKTQHSQK